MPYSNEYERSLYRFYGHDELHARINVHSNNVANAQTTGFKAENMTSKVFDVQDTYRRGDGAVTNIGSVDYAVVPAATHVNLVQGNIQMTNSATDFF